MHVVPFEAQQQQPLTQSEKKSIDKAPLFLSAFISTHRLSRRKTSRSPPVLIHRAKISIGGTKTLCPTRMPMEVTWAPKEVYFSNSSEANHLIIFRVELFASNIADGENSSTVSVPRKIILLPESARSRSVYYFPPKAGDTRALILIGS